MWKHCTLGEVCTATQGVQITKSNQISNAKEGYKRYLYISDFKHDKKLEIRYFFENQHNSAFPRRLDAVTAETTNRSKPQGRPT